jgi:serine/threonine-protein kinase
VAEAHALGIVHRDLKPSNLFLADRAGKERVVKVLDFGISKVQPGPEAEVGDEDLTQTSMVLGSPRYISPEQARNAKDVDARADIFGVVLYQIIAGEPPFGGDTFGEILTNILLSDPPPLPSLRADLPAGLAEVVERCLQRERDERYGDVAELAHALAPFGGPRAADRARRVAAIIGEEAPRHDDALRDPRTDVADAPTSATSTQPTVATWAQPESRRPPRRMGLIVAAAAVGVALGLATWFYPRQAPAPASRPRPHPRPSRARTCPPRRRLRRRRRHHETPPPPARTPARAQGHARRHPWRARAPPPLPPRPAPSQAPVPVPPAKPSDPLGRSD